jgi:hypothetical protein
LSQTASRTFRPDEWSSFSQGNMSNASAQVSRNASTRLACHRLTIAAIDTL